MLASNSGGLDIICSALACFVVFVLITRKKWPPEGLRLPPGPKGRIFFGNAAEMPTHHEWETFTRWAKEYGNLVYVKVFGLHIVIVNSIDVAYDLFEKRSSIYSDRPDFPMLNDLMGFNWNFGLMHYGSTWRRYRKVFHQKFHAAASAVYHPIQTRHTRVLLQRLHNSPDDFLEHLRHHSGAIILEVVYGIQVLPTGDPHIQNAEKVIAALSEAVMPGAFLVDTLHILKYVPEWVPGADFRRKARIWREPITEMAIAPFGFAKRALASGTAGPSFTTSLLEELSSRIDAPPDEEDVIRYTGAVAYAGGSDTTTSTLMWLILAMVLFPEVQRKAQSELDAFIGTSRLPVFEDRKSLKYIDALCKELYRWRPVAPVGIAHSVRQDDVYGDYFIPRGSVLVGNTWAMLHDQETFGPNPEDFNPDRFMIPGVPDPVLAFGFGRRTCPGRHLADNTVFISVASILKAFTISRAKDESGIDIPVGLSTTSGATLRPLPFRCAFKFRSAHTESLLLEHTDD